MRTIALSYILATVILVVCSFYVPPADPPLERPRPYVVEPRPKPLPYGVDLRFQSVVQYYSDETGVPMFLACRMFGQETGNGPMAGAWYPDAVSWAGATGLAQIMPANLVPFSIWYNDGRPIDPMDPVTSIRVGVRYLADLHAEIGSWRYSVMAYDGGLGHWRNPHRWGDWRQESVDYVRAILKE